MKRFQARHGLPADGVVGEYTYAAMNVSAQVRLGQLETNLVRLRSMSGYLGDRYVMVNIPAAQIEAVENDRVVLRHTAVVGKIDRQTPIVNSKINEINFNPYWNAPESIVRKDIIPLMRKDPKYLTRTTSASSTGRQRDRSDDRSTGTPTKRRNTCFRQDPGDSNSMASVKINFPSPDGVYMHDTPQQGLFNKLMRFDSSGCVRVQNVRDLVTWLLRDTPGWTRQQIEATIKSGENIAGRGHRCRCRSTSPTSRPGRPATASCSSATTSTASTASTSCRFLYEPLSTTSTAARTRPAQAGFFVGGILANPAKRERPRSGDSPSTRVSVL